MYGCKIEHTPTNDTKNISSIVEEEG